MNKLKANKSGMTLVEVLVAMALFAILFLFMSGIMFASVKLNSQTRTYDQETDVQVKEAENYNPLAAEADGITNPTANISTYDYNGASADDELVFSFSGISKTIRIKANAYQVNSADEQNGFQLKFFESTGPDITDGKYWVRVINVSSTDNAVIYLYLPKEDAGSFYLKNESEPYTSVVSKTVPVKTSLGIGYDMSGSGTKYFWATTRDGLASDQLDSIPLDKDYILINSTSLSGYDRETDGYIDIYYTDDGFMSYDEYQNYLSAP